MGSIDFQNGFIAGVSTQGAFPLGLRGFKEEDEGKFLKVEDGKVGLTQNIELSRVIVDPNENEGMPGQILQIGDDYHIEATWSQKRKFLFIGDSYAEGHPIGKIKETWTFNEDTWPYLVSKYLGLSKDEYYVSALGGTGFINKRDDFDFLGLIKYAAGDRNFSTTPSRTDNLDNIERNSITNIVIGGGYNDISFVSDETNKNNLKQNIKLTISKARELFPNATISVFFLGWDKDNFRKGLLLKTAEIYNLLLEEGVKFFPYAGNVLQERFVGVDGFHPNEEGEIALAKWISNSLLGGASVPAVYLERHILLIGDSYGVKTQNLIGEFDTRFNWIYYTKFDLGCFTDQHNTWEQVDFNDDLIFSHAANEGSGFWNKSNNGYDFVDLANYVATKGASSNTPPQNYHIADTDIPITDIVIVEGYSDINAIEELDEPGDETISDWNFREHLWTQMSRIRTLFPYAKIHCIFAGTSKNIGERLKLYNIQTACEEFSYMSKTNFHPGVNNLLSRWNYIGKDGHTLSTEGANLLGAEVAAVLKGNAIYCAYSDSWSPFYDFLSIDIGSRVTREGLCSLSVHNLEFVRTNDNTSEANVFIERLNNQVPVYYYDSQTNKYVELISNIIPIGHLYDNIQFLGRIWSDTLIKQTGAVRYNETITTTITTLMANGDIRNDGTTTTYNENVHKMVFLEYYIVPYAKIENITINGETFSALVVRDYDPQRPTGENNHLSPYIYAEIKNSENMYTLEDTEKIVDIKEKGVEGGKEITTTTTVIERDFDYIWARIGSSVIQN